MHCYSHFGVSDLLTGCLVTFTLLAVAMDGTAADPSPPMRASACTHTHTFSAFLLFPPVPVCNFVCLSVSLCLSLSVSVCLCLSLSVSVCLCLSLSVSVCLCLSLSLSLSLSVSVSVCLFVYLSTFYLSISRLLNLGMAFPKHHSRLLLGFVGHFLS